MLEKELGFPKYVTDGHHIYLWHPEYEQMFKEGQLRASDPPPPREKRKLSPRQQAKLEQERKVALADAERQVRLLKQQGESSDTAPPEGATGATCASSASGATGKIIDLDE